MIIQDPEYVSVYKDSEATTPQELKQVSYAKLNSVAVKDCLINLKWIINDLFLVYLTDLIGSSFRVMLYASYKIKSISYTRLSKTI